MPLTSNLGPKGFDCVCVSRNGIVRDVPAHYGVEPSPLLRDGRSEEHTSELQSRSDLVCRLLLEDPRNPKIHALSLHDALPIYKPLHSYPREPPSLAAT